MARPLSFLGSMILLFLLAPCAAAQFQGFFDGMFGGQQQQQQQQQEQQQQEQQPPSGVRGWDILNEVSCQLGYLCPGTVMCMNKPADCPCPYPEDIKCALPGDASPFVCARMKRGKSAQQVCDGARRLAGKL